jgi:diaminohydroxyphosphoribosylaminopyrimidine deaminase/5-amino-6-(5-phosphoribosylamino)uracil reductase
VISTVEEQDKYFIKRALKLAEKGRGWVSPNPMVGALIVKDGKVIAEGFHQKFGEAHAEINALDKAGDNAAGAALYSNLEPCVHKGKTGPCTERILAAGIARVVVGMKDPNPLVNGKGINFLRSKGIVVKDNILHDECVALNRGYIKHVTTGRPLVTLKIAQTLDARIATSTGNSKWITSKEARIWGHRLRSEHDAIIAGVGTVLADDPQLTTRLIKGVSPKRIILDSQLRIPLDANVISGDNASNTTIITTEEASKEKIARIEERGALVHVLEADERGWVPQDVLWETIGKMGITSVLIEGGNAVQTECIKGKNADRIVVFVAPKILGTGIDAIGDLSIKNINAAIEIINMKVKRFNSGDLMISGDFKKDE